MTARQHVDQAKLLWEQARESAALARDRWAQLCKAQYALLEGFRRAGFPASQATRELENLIEEQAQQYERALEKMENLCRACAELREQLEGMDSDPFVN